MHVCTVYDTVSSNHKIIRLLTFYEQGEMFVKICFYSMLKAKGCVDEG